MSVGEGKTFWVYTGVFQRGGGKTRVGGRKKVSEARESSGKGRQRDRGKRN